MEIAFSQEMIEDDNLGVDIEDVEGLREEVKQHGILPTARSRSELKTLLVRLRNTLPLSDSQQFRRSRRCP